MPQSKPIARVFVEPSGSTAELCLLIQLSYQPCLVWQWDLPYLLWNEWGLTKTAAWLAEQFRRHDFAAFEAVGSHELVRALQHGLEQHQRYYGAAWLTSCRP